MKPLTMFFAIAGLVLTASSAEKTIAWKDLPAAVQKAVTELTKGAEIKGISTETEKGVKSYEIETVAGGKHRDLTVDAKGNVVSVEEETAIDAIPAAARAAILKKVAGGKIAIIETVTKGTVVFYEAGYATKGGKRAEYAVNADGAPIKD